jgi:hypothetical protein
MYNLNNDSMSQSGTTAVRSTGADHMTMKFGSCYFCDIHMNSQKPAMQVTGRSL